MWHGYWVRAQSPRAATGEATRKRGWCPATRESLCTATETQHRQKINAQNIFQKRKKKKKQEAKSVSYKEGKDMILALRKIKYMVGKSNMQKDVKQVRKKR